MLKLLRRQRGSNNPETNCSSGSDKNSERAFQDTDRSTSSSERSLFEYVNLLERTPDWHSVEFGRVKVRKTLSRTRYTSKEFRNCWWSLAEYLALEQARKRVIDCESVNASRSPRISVNRLQTRGLESYIQSTADVQTQSRKEAFHAILALQEEQREAGINDPEAIAQKYQAVSSLSRLRALHIAALDQHEAQAMQHGEGTRRQQKGCTCDNDGFVVRKKLTFNPKVKARTIRGLAHYTQQEIKDCWNSRSESKAILRSCAILIKTYNAKEEKSPLIMDSDDCIRGLESHTEDGARNKLDHRRNAYRSVLLALAAEEVRFQNLRRRQAVANVVAASYRRASSECCLQAIERALNDQIEANEVHQEQ